MPIFFAKLANLGQIWSHCFALIFYFDIQGCKIKMDDSGNILVKRIAKSNVYVKNTTEENAISNDILKVCREQ